MKISLFKISWVDFVLIALFASILFAAMTFVLSLLMGMSYLELINNNWVTPVFMALILPLIQVYVNRNAVLVITDIEYLSKCKDQLDSIICSKGYIAIEKSSNYVIYNRKTKIGRFFNLFFRENITVIDDEEKLTINAKRNILGYIESKIKKLK